MFDIRSGRYSLPSSWKSQIVAVHGRLDLFFPLTLSGTGLAASVHWDCKPTNQPTSELEFNGVSYPPSYQQAEAAKQRERERRRERERERKIKSTRESPPLMLMVDHSACCINRRELGRRVKDPFLNATSPMDQPEFVHPGSILRKID